MVTVVMGLQKGARAGTSRMTLSLWSLSKIIKKRNAAQEWDRAGFENYTA